MADDERVIGLSAGLLEGGRGLRFPLGDATNGFVIRFHGRVCAYVNRCPHMGTELDWQEGEFFETSGLYLVCSTHGALFEPLTGKCVAGPCRGASLEPLQVREREGCITFDREVPHPNNDQTTKPR